MSGLNEKDRSALSRCFDDMKKDTDLMNHICDLTQKNLETQRAKVAELEAENARLRDQLGTALSPSKDGAK